MSETAVQDAAPEVAAPTDPMARLAEVLAEGERRAQEREEAAERRMVDMLSKLAGQGEPSTPSRKEMTADPTDYMHDRFDGLKYERGDFELAMMLFDGAKRLSVRPLKELEPPEDFVRAWRYHVHENGPKIKVANEAGKIVRAMDTAESGFGQQLVGAQYVNQLWEAARNNDTIVGRIREVPMTAVDQYIPIDGDLPEMYFVGESTADSATAYTASNTGSNRRQLSAKKFTIQEIWSGELDEESIIPFTPFLREKLNMAAAVYLGSAYYNGDTTNAGTGNINSDDADPTDTKHYLAFDGIRHYWLVDATGNGVDAGGPVVSGDIETVRGLLNGQGNDIDNLIKTINWGKNARDLLLVCDWDTYLALTQLDEVTTIDKYGPQATVITGELANFRGIPIISPPYAQKTEADGKASTTEANNTRGQITILNPRGFVAGVRRDVQLFFDRVQRTDQFLFELYTRRAFNRWGDNVAGGLYNITV